ncbi:hypothetical protein E2C01_093211 [Portunus trituberculatus]|uniref:Uncharacterized protein n=1 Tax=Portunus trituberculatus TaxID=210409 RepID=A0A5B7JTW9_PORTR|nr:hypothetical protein [Portunus trituberculatus]
MSQRSPNPDPMSQTSQNQVPMSPHPVLTSTILRRKRRRRQNTSSVLVSLVSPRPSTCRCTASDPPTTTNTPVTPASLTTAQRRRIHTNTGRLSLQVTNLK